MIIKKESNNKITVYMDDTPTHARKLIYSKERNEMCIRDSAYAARNPHTKKEEI